MLKKIKIVVMALILALMAIFVIFGYTKKTKAETIPIDAINDYQNLEELQGSKYLVYSKDFYRLQFYATSGMDSWSFRITLPNTHDIWSWTYKTIYVMETGASPWETGLNYFPNSLYMQTQLGRAETINLTSAQDTPQFMLIEFDGYTTEDFSIGIYALDVRYLNSFAVDVTGMSEKRLVSLISTNGLLSEEQVKANPNKYGLYSEQQYATQYGTGYNDGYQKALEDLQEDAPGPSNWFLAIFDGISKMFAITIFPGVTLGLICLVPFSITFVFAIFKLLRGGD